jgi:hypothetical protein
MLNGVQRYSIVAVILMIVILVKMNMKECSVQCKHKTTTIGIYTCGLLVWPIIWMNLAKEHAFTKQVCFSFLWPIMMTFLEIHVLKYQSLDNPQRSRNMLTMDANALCSLSFALSSILGASRDKSCKNMFLFGVLGCVAFVMPNVQVPPNTSEGFIIEIIQKIFLWYSTGLLLGGSSVLICN